MEIEINRKLIVDDNDIADIWDNGAESGGINYWCGLVEVIRGNKEVPYGGSKSLIEGCTFILHDSESDDKWTLTKEDMYRAVKICADKYPWHLYFENGNDGRGDLKLDLGIMDAGDCDCIIQIACMGDIVFG